MVEMYKLTQNALPRKFYNRSTVVVAKSLLGKKIIRTYQGHNMSAIITETEAYGHEDDSASHAFRNMTPRNKAMFGQVGRAYVYFTYGMHYCFNIVARDPKTQAGAVLIRAVRPESGIDIMIKNRRNSKHISDGPAKLSQALNITKKQYGKDLTTVSELYIADGIRHGQITTGSRVGISTATNKLWNFRIDA